MTFLSVILAFVLMVPELLVKWITPGSFDILSVSVRGTDEVAAQCLKSGLELRYRYELRICREASFWYDRCGSNRVIVRSVQFDPITETFKLVRDRLGDENDPEVTSTDQEGVAIHSLSSINRLVLSDLFADDSDLLKESRKYMQVRLLTQCKGVSSRTVEKLSYFLSLGMLRTNGFDSGWISFKLEGAKSQP